MKRVYSIRTKRYQNLAFIFIDTSRRTRCFPLLCVRRPVCYPVKIANSNVLQMWHFHIRFEFIFFVLKKNRRSFETKSRWIVILKSRRTFLSFISNEFYICVCINSQYFLYSICHYHYTSDKSYNFGTTYSPEIYKG